MRSKPKSYNIDGHQLLLRSAEKDDAKIMLPFLKRISGESRFMLREADECMDMTLEQEQTFIEEYIKGERKCFVVAELDGEFVGNASFVAAGCSRRHAHRALISIALYSEYTGMGIGKRLFSYMLDVIENLGFESAELTVIEGNNRAIHMYESFGFVEIGRIPQAIKYDDGSYADDIFMMKKF